MRKAFKVILRSGTGQVLCRDPAAPFDQPLASIKPMRRASRVSPATDIQALHPLRANALKTPYRSGGHCLALCNTRRISISLRAIRYTTR